MRVNLPLFCMCGHGLFLILIGLKRLLVGMLILLPVVTAMTTYTKNLQDNMREHPMHIYPHLQYIYIHIGPKISEENAPVPSESSEGETEDKISSPSTEGSSDGGTTITNIHSQTHRQRIKCSRK